MKTRRGRGQVGGYFQLESSECRISGHGYGDFIHLRDDHGRVWHGSAEAAGNDMVHYRFRDPSGNTISGISDRHALLLRDSRGNSWKGFLLG